jgi:uncharacterized protein
MVAIRQPTRRDVLRGLAALGVGLSVGAAAHGTLYARHQLTLTRSPLPVPGLPPALDGLTIGLLSDTHHGPFVPRAFIDDAVRLLQAQQPDIIVLGGDYVTQQDRRFMEASAEAFAPLSAPHGVFGILGNHDDDVEMPRALRRHRVAVLGDARTVLTIRGASLDLIGLRFWTRGRADIERVARGAGPVSLLLAHDPRRLHDAKALTLSAVLSGHTHGGQIVLPGLGPIAARKFPVAEGLWRDHGTSLFVSRGLGTVYVPCRINCPPEVALLTLRGVAAGAPRQVAGTRSS